MYKVEELRRRHAQGILLVHTDESAGYGWNVIESMRSIEGIRLAEVDEGMPLSIRGWLSSAGTASLLGQSVASLIGEAKRKDFCMRKTGRGISVSVEVKELKRPFEHIHRLSLPLPLCMFCWSLLSLAIGSGQQFFHSSESQYWLLTGWNR